LPKDTFLNLKPEKKETIELAALKEFSAYGLAESSVNRIIKASCISTGSFYQYFEDITDLFTYVCTKYANLKMEYMRREVKVLLDNSFINVIQAIYRGGLRFALDYTEASRVFLDAFKYKDKAAFSKLNPMLPALDITEWVRSLIDKAVKDGEIRGDLETELVFALINGVNTTVMEYLLAARTKGGKPPALEDILEDFEQLAISVLLDGIRAK
jgi:AcrR family transcriptional regulator